MGFNINKAGITFKNAPAGPAWKLANRNTGSPSFAVGSSTTLTVPQSMPNGYRNQGRRAQATALGVRIIGSVACDNAGGATTLYAQKVHILALFKVNLMNSFVQPYWQKEVTLADLYFAGQIANLPVTWLDREFYSTQVVGTRAAVEGPLPPQFKVTDTAISGLTPIGTFRPEVWPTARTLEAVRDSFWRCLEDRVLVRQAAAATTTLDTFISIPLCARHQGAVGLERDSLPLELLANATKPWALQITYDQTPVNRLIGFDSGSITVNTFELWVHCVPMKLDDEMFLGRPWYLRFETFASPYRLLSGEIPLAVYNPPVTRSNETYTVDARAYVPGVEYPNVCPDFAVGNQTNWYGSDGVQNFPDDLDNTNPTTVYLQLWNLSPSRPKLHAGLASDVLVYSGIAVTGTRGYTSTADTSMDTTLGTVSTLPIRVLSCVLIDVEGCPGLASQDSSCNRPYINFAGTFDFTSTAISSMSNIYVLALNNSPADEAMLKNLAADCCGAPNVTWERQKAGLSEKAAMVADVIGGWVSTKPSLATAGAPAPSMKAPA